PASRVFRSPSHPYTEGLLLSMPSVSGTGTRRRRLRTIEGSVPNLIDLPPGCRFAPRCSYVGDDCLRGDISMARVDLDHGSRCVRPDEVGRPAAGTSWKTPPE
ncbi:MAG TPA: oligopeptide/dipeptide ABC transporter ATP-binding protein, partial [Blastocatellia bacterium]|nr:oligopeptide/dipeptide ABC transporter ATP-binding protein [Blastocatellia bacterium]